MRSMKPKQDARQLLHGVASSRAFQHRKSFEYAVDRAIGPRVRADGSAGVDLWCALANIEWADASGNVASFSLRTAGEFVAWIREEGGYLDWYCSGTPEQVAPWIEEALGAEGWFWRNKPG